MPGGNREVAARLHEIADLLDLQNVDYKPRAYRRAARNVAALDEDVETPAERGELEDVEGVGESIAEKIREYLDSGRIGYAEELRAESPLDWEGLTGVEGVGRLVPGVAQLRRGWYTASHVRSAPAAGE